jgi:glycogen(starch) synthase
VTRVLMTTDAVGGVWTYSIELARALASMGISTTLATMGPQPSAARLASARGIPGLEIETSAFRLEWMEHPWADVAAAGQWLLDLERRVSPIMIHSNGFSHASLPWLAPVVVVAHSCVMSWSEAVGESPGRPGIERYRAAVAEGLHAADWVVAPTHAMLSSLRRHYGTLPRASVVPNGRDARRFPPADKEPLIISAGRLWDRAKNVDLLRAVAPSLPWPVVVAGEGAESSGLRHLGQLSEDEMASWLGRASICALPARYEPFGLLPLEAALAGCALVLGDIPSLREVWGAAADYVNPDDEASLRAALCSLAADDDLRLARAAAARTRALELTPERMVQAYARVYGCAAARSDGRMGQCAS